MLGPTLIAAFKQSIFPFLKTNHMEQETLPLGTSLSREDMKNIKGGWLPENTYWTCTGYPGKYIIMTGDVNPSTNCPTLFPPPGSCSFGNELATPGNCLVVTTP